MSDWFPDWRGEICVLVAAGPSAAAADLGRLRDRCRVVVINRSFELAPWADALYACDLKFWEVYPAARQFAGLKITQDMRAVEAFPGLLHMPMLKTEKGAPAMGLSDKPGHIGGGGNSGFQCLDAVTQFGASQIYLVGFDMAGGHWHDPHSPPLHNPSEDAFGNWIGCFERARDDLMCRGARVFNCNPHSQLKCFPYAPLAQAVDENAFGSAAIAAA